LVVGGGSDPYGFVGSLMEQLNGISEDCTFHVFTNSILEIPSKVNTRVYPIGPDLDRVASRADLVITTASSSSLEFVAREIPTLVVCATSNQEALYRQLGDFKCASQVGSLRDGINWEFDVASITAAIESKEIRESLRHRIEGLIDLQGPSRVVNLIENNLVKGGLSR
jgi:spore coat polysaccharide biosynthesis predicted glycosyltransferase SpsG